MSHYYVSIQSFQQHKKYDREQKIVHFISLDCLLERNRMLNSNLNSQMKSILPQSECKDDENKFGLVNNYLFCPLGDKIVTKCHLITRFDASDWWTMQIIMVSKMINSNIINFSKNWVFSNSKENSNDDINKQ